MRLDCGCRDGLDFDSVFIKPKRSRLTTRQFDIKRDFILPYGPKLTDILPIIAANMDHTGTVAMAEALNPFDAMVAYHKFQPSEVYKDMKHYYNWISIGYGDEEIERLQKICLDLFAAERHAYVNICIDVANGYTQGFADHVSKVRDTFPNARIMAGNVATYEMTEQLIMSGADIVKIGIGPGSGCTTRKITGVGVPQLSAIAECADAAHGLNGHICADGGCTVPGDISKAFCAGADFVMLGGMLAGHDQCDATYVGEDGSEYAGGVPDNVKIVGMKFYGMSSAAAQEKHYGGVKEYRAPEGKEVVVPYRGDVRNTMLEITGGIRSCMTYIGAQRLKDMPKCATFVRTTKQLNEVFS